MIHKIHADIKTAMVEKDTIKKDVLKMVLDKANAAAKEKKIDTPTDEMVMNAIKKEMKQLGQTVDMLKQNGKETSPLCVESEQKAEILATYLPKQLNEDELREALQQFIVDNGLDVTARGPLMKAVMPVFKDKADGKLINKVISTL